MGCFASLATPAGKAAILREGAAKVKDFRDVWDTHQKLGQGSFGMVFECTRKDISEKTIYAVKMLEHKHVGWYQRIRTSAEAAHQWDVFFQEWSMMKHMDHPNLIRLVASYIDDYFVYFVMEKYECNIVAAILPQGRGSIPYILGEITNQMLSAIVYLHNQKIVHRDVKADNYLTDSRTFSSLPFRVVLTDVSTAKYVEDGIYLTELKGTQPYWAPEVLARSYRHPVDVWAIGVIVWSMLTLRFPFASAEETYNKVLNWRKKYMTQDQFALVDACLTKDPASRASANSAQNSTWVRESAEECQRIIWTTKESPRSNGKDEGGLDNVVTAAPPGVPEENLFQSEQDSLIGHQRGSDRTGTEIDASIALAPFGFSRNSFTKEDQDRLKNKLKLAVERYDAGEKVAVPVEQAVVRRASQPPSPTRSLSPTRVFTPPSRGAETDSEAKTPDWQSTQSAEMAMTPMTASTPGAATRNCSILWLNDEVKFEVARQRVGEAKVYSWWDAKRCLDKHVRDVETRCGPDDLEASLPVGATFSASEAGDVVLSEPYNVQDLKQQLEKHSIDTSAFGENGTKTLQQLYRELELNESHLVERGRNCVIRVVDIIALRLQSPRGRFLVQVAEAKPGGHERAVQRLPGRIRQAGESARPGGIREELARLLETLFHTTPAVIQVNIDDNVAQLETVLAADDAKSFPGMESLYRRFVFHAFVRSNVPQDLAPFGLGVDDDKPFQASLSDGRVFKWEWWDMAKCEEAGLPTATQVPKGTMEARGYRPVVCHPRWTEEKLIRVLEQHGVDVSRFSVGQARTMSQLVEEVNSGESTFWGQSRELVRHLEVLTVRIKNKFGAYLIETGHVFGDGQNRERNEFPATKIRPFEDKVWSVRRLLWEADIPYAHARICFGPERREQQESPSYPGVMTIYSKQLVQVDLADIDITNFVSGSLSSKWFRMGDPVKIQESSGL